MAWIETKTESSVDLLGCQDSGGVAGRPGVERAETYYGESVSLEAFLMGLVRKKKG